LIHEFLHGFRILYRHPYRVTRAARGAKRLCQKRNDAIMDTIEVILHAIRHADIQERPQIRSVDIAQLSLSQTLWICRFELRCGNRVPSALYLSNGIFVFAGATLGPIYALFAEDIGADLFTVSALVATLLVSRIIFNGVVKKFGDQIRAKEDLLLTDFLIRAVVWLSFVFVGNVTGLFIIQILLGIGEAMSSPAFNVLFAKALLHNSVLFLSHILSSNLEVCGF